MWLSCAGAEPQPEGREVPLCLDLWVCWGQAEVCNPEKGGGRQVFLSSDKRPFSFPSWERGKRIFIGCFR